MVATLVVVPTTGQAVTLEDAAARAFSMCSERRIPPLLILATS